MKLITLNIFVTLILFTSCHTSKTATSTTSKETTSIENVKWKLVTLMGKDVSDKNAFITFSKDDDKVYGNGSCNNFSGTYQLKEGNQITLSKMVATLMACMDMAVENQFMVVLERADNYSLNGNNMTLNKARMAPLAVFEAAEKE
ncbi:META domain-containing protein [Mariniflexile gromovii]|uniref:META domain-containing protein n=1 Tax=Mariniflexile gromovii TaxID=362523 RepID=A0ABS4BRM0_9FLAO|nr:META domain-containing protein [Mariniflexile gromovii]MBP0902757.1 META domain-containing protein [Mariniflexile gromovii]